MKQEKTIKALFLFLAFALTVTLLPANTITAQAAKKTMTYKVVYKLNGGTNNKSNPKKIKKNKSVKLKAPTRKGYTFKGWYKDKKFKTKTTKVKGTKSAKNRTVYAKWVKNATTPPTPGKPDTDDTQNKPTDTETGKDDSNTTTPTIPSKPTESQPDTLLENPSNMYCIDGKNNTHDWQTETLNCGLHYIAACGFDLTPLYRKAWSNGDKLTANLIYDSGTDTPYLYEDEKMPCPGCGGWCNSDAGNMDGMRIVQYPDIVEKTQCTRCKQIRPDGWVEYPDGHIDYHWKYGENADYDAMLDKGRATDSEYAEFFNRFSEYIERHRIAEGYYN